jgi:hypothetical protein
MALSIKNSGFRWKGKPIRLAGDHTWNTVQRMNGETVGIDRITGNVTKLWTVENKAMIADGSLWGSNSRGTIMVKDLPWKKDGSLNGAYYHRLDKAVAAAERRNIVAVVSLFEGSIPDIFPKAWETHAFNGLGPKSHDQVHTKGRWNRYQRAHVRRSVETLANRDNVVFEVGNELMASSTRWFQGQVVKWVKKWSDKLIGVSYARGIRASRGQNEARWMKRTGADWFGPTATAINQGQFRNTKEAVILDTDHSWPLNSNVQGLQAAVKQGHDILLMAGFRGTFLRDQASLAGDRAFIDRIASPIVF